MKDGSPNNFGPLSEPAVPFLQLKKHISKLALVDEDGVKKCQAAYMIATLNQKAKVGRFATEKGTTNTIRHFANEMSNLKEGMEDHLLV